MAFGIGWLGDSRRIGFGWALFWALLLSPLIGFAIVMASPRKGTYEEELARLQDRPAKENPKPSPSRRVSMGIASELAALKTLHESGALTDEEFEAAKKKVL